MPDRVRKHFQRIGFGEIGNAVEFALFDQPRDQRSASRSNVVAQDVDRGRRQDARQHGAGAGVQRRIGFQDDARRTPWRLFAEIAQAHAGRRAIGLPVRQRVADLLMPGHRPDAVLLEPHHGTGLAQGSRDADRDRAGIHAKTDRWWKPDGRLSYPCSHACSRFRLLQCGDRARRLSAFCRLRRGLSPLAFCDLNGRESSDHWEAYPMPTPRSASLPDDPALLAIDGPIATITLNRPAAFNSIDLVDREKAGAAWPREVEADDDIRVLVIEGEGRAFCAGGDLQTIGAAAAADTIAPVVGELLKHYHAFIETLRRMPKIVLTSVHGSAAGAGHGRSPSSPTSASPPTMPASRRPTPRSACRPMAAARSAWSAPSATAARAADLSRRRQLFRRSRPMTGAWSPRSFRQPN